MNTVKVKLGFVPSYRGRWSDWAQKMRDESLSTMDSLPGVEVVVPQPVPDGGELDPVQGLTPYGGVQNLDDAELVADYFNREKVDGVVLCPLDFGDERSASKIAEKLHVPVLLYATKEPP